MWLETVSERGTELSPGVLVLVRRVILSRFLEPGGDAVLSPLGIETTTVQFGSVGVEAALWIGVPVAETRKELHDGRATDGESGERHRGIKFKQANPTKINSAVRPKG